MKLISDNKNINDMLFTFDDEQAVPAGDDASEAPAEEGMSTPTEGGTEESSTEATPEAAPAEGATEEAGGEETPVSGM